MAVTLNIRTKALVALTRVMMAGAFLFFLGAMAFVWGTAIAGDTAALFDLLDWPEAASEDLPLAWPKIAIGLGITMLLLGSTGVLFWSVHKFFRNVSYGNYFGIQTVKLIRRVSICFICFWLAFILLESVLPPILTLGFPPEHQASLEWVPFDLEVIFLITGVTFFTVSKILRGARELDEENKQIV